MTFERIMAMEIKDEERYQLYREAMEPLLNQAGGRFGYDFRIQEVLRSKSDGPINRVFTIEFSDEQSMQAFFSDPEYLAVKTAYFEGAVGHVSVISMHEKSA